MFEVASVTSCYLKSHFPTGESQFIDIQILRQCMTPDRSSYSGPYTIDHRVVSLTWSAEFRELLAHSEVKWRPSISAILG